MMRMRPLLKALLDKVRRRPDLYTPIYRVVFPEASIEKKLFYNFGSGEWRHRYWTNVDYASDYYHYDSELIDIPWDISRNEPVAVQSGIAELVYCSHTCEHLTNGQNRFMFREAARILKPEGVFRVTCPNVEKYHAAYKRRDVFVNYHYGYDFPFGAPGKNTFARENMVIWLTNEIATQLVQSSGDGHQPVFAGKVQELEAIFNSMPLEDACDKLCGMIDFRLQQIVPGHHINWWTFDKMRRELLAAGFSQVSTSVPGGSIAAVMRDRKYFDLQAPAFSLFVDAIK